MRGKQPTHMVGPSHIMELLVFSLLVMNRPQKNAIILDPFSETVCIQAPLLRLGECQLTIVLAPRCLYIAETKVVRFFLNQQCHIKITIVNFLEPLPIQYCYIEVAILSFFPLFLIEYCDIKIIIFNFDTESSWNKRGMFYELF